MNRDIIEGDNSKEKSESKQGREQRREALLSLICASVLTVSAM